MPQGHQDTKMILTTDYTPVCRSASVRRHRLHRFFKKTLCNIESLFLSGKTLGFRYKKMIQYILILFLFNFQLKAQHYNFRNYSVEHGLPQATINAIYQDHNGYLWFATAGGGVSKFDGIKFTNYNTRDGLGQNEIVSILEDRKGNMWFGTAGRGVSKFVASNNENESSVFINFTTDDGLCNNYVRAICEDSKGYLWFGTDGGISEFDGKRFYNYNEKNGLYNINIFSIIEDNQGNLVFGTGKGVYKYYRRIGFVNITTKQPINYFPIYAILQDSKDNYWFGSFGGGVTEYNPNEHPDHQFTNFTTSNGLTDNRIHAIIEDKEGNIWFGTNEGGVCMLSREIIYEHSKGRSDYFFKTFTSAEGLCSDEILSIMQDRESNIWFGTADAGLCKFESMRFSIYSKNEGLNNNMVFSIFEDRSGNYWFGTYGGISKYDPLKSIYTNYTVQDGLIHNKVRSIIEDRNGDFWIATYGGVSKFVRSKSSKASPIFINYAKKDTCPDGRTDCIGGLSNNMVNAILEDRNGNIWFGTFGGGVTMLQINKNEGINEFVYYTENDGLLSNTVRCIYEDSKGFLWFGTREGVSKLITSTPGSSLDNKSKETSFHFINYTVEDGLSNNYVFTILEDDEGNMWFGTYGGGVSELIRNIPRYKAGRPRMKLPGKSQSTISKKNLKNPKNIHFNNFTEEDGLSSNTVYFIIFDDDKNLWIGTNKGIDNLDLDFYKKTLQKKFKHYGKEEGFVGIECNTNAVLKDRSGDLWFGTIKGAIKYTNQKDNLNVIETKTIISHIRIFLKDTLLQQNAVLPYDQNHISFEFTGICLTNPNKVRYSYVLENFDKDWAPRTSNNHAVYSNLPPGSYTFKVESCNNDGLWNREPTTFSFTITSPFWKTWWFYILCISTSFGSIFFFIKLRERNLVKEKKRLEDQVNLRTKQLQKEKEKLQKVNIDLEKLSIVASETDNGVIITDAHGNIEWTNEGFTRLHGYSIEELKIKRGSNLSDSSHNPDIKRLIAECIEKKHPVVYEVLNNTKNGKEVWIQTTLTPILSPDGKIKKMVAIDSDITKIKKVQEEIRQKNIHIKDSIVYAKQMQKAILPSTKNIHSILPQTFILNKPKEIVSADLYLFFEKNSKIFIALCDATPHGIPGAFVSMIGNNLLNQIISEKNVENPAEILKLLNQGLLNTFPYSGKITANTDGMEMALCCVDKKSNELQFAGAKRSMYLLRSNTVLSSSDSNREITLEEFNGDIAALGGSTAPDYKFSCHIIKYKKDDTIYLFTEAFIDQPGGPNTEKFLSKRFKQMLLDIQHLPMKEQKQVLKDTFVKWKGDLPQNDDVLVIGIRL